ncbi:MAG: outer membrane lipoprotein-sorting protein [Candidatus Moduliflexus flocculans]|nr:outer membrane lipoprotein-sorting protein [Candidatus Moduliflexus flocculans]
MSTRARMVITDKSGAKTERLLDQYSATVDGADADDDRVPETGRRGGHPVPDHPGARASPRTGGYSCPPWARSAASPPGRDPDPSWDTDFSYDDVSLMDRDVDLDTFTLAREEYLDGKACWVLEARPKDPGYQYSRMLLWIGKARLHLLEEPRCTTGRTPWRRP